MYDDEARMTFTEHLGELRKRLILSLLMVFASFVVCYYFSDQLFDLIARPIAAKAPWIAMNPVEPIWVKLQLSLYAALVISLPVIIYEICAFVFPGLRPTERRVVNFLILGCGGLATVGVLVAYFEILPAFLPVVMQFAPREVVVQLRMNETVSLIVKCILGFAIAFQFPMVIFVLVYLGILSPAVLKKFRRHAIVAMMIAAAILMPSPDVASMLMMFFPLYALYEASIWLSYLIVWRKKRLSTQPQP